jgi:hypothetical protein
MMGAPSAGSTSSPNMPTARTSDRDFGVVHVLTKLRPEDDMGEHSVAAGSLVRAVGMFGEDVDPADGAPIMRASFYRHWPRYFFVTRASAELMRQ